MDKNTHIRKEKLCARHYPGRSCECDSCLRKGQQVFLKVKVVKFSICLGASCENISFRKGDSATGESLSRIRSGGQIVFLFVNDKCSAYDAMRTGQTDDRVDHLDCGNAVRISFDVSQVTDVSFASVRTPVRRLIIINSILT